MGNPACAHPRVHDKAWSQEWLCRTIRKMPAADGGRYTALYDLACGKQRLVCRGIGRDVFGQAQNSGLFAGFARDLVDSLPGRLFVGRGFRSRQSDLHFQTVR